MKFTLSILFLVGCIVFLSLHTCMYAENDTTEIIKLYKDVRKKYSADRDISGKDSLILEKALKLSRENNYLVGEAQYYDILGVHERNSSNYAKAIDYHQQAYQLIENTGRLKEKAIILNNIGVVYRRIDDLDHATSYHLRALEIAENINDQGSISVSLNSLGNIFLTGKKYTKALEYFTIALKREQEANNKLGIAINYNNIGSVYENQGDSQKAIEFYLKSLEVNKELGSNKGMGICYLSLGKVFTNLNKLDEAHKYLKKAVEIHLNLNDRIYSASAYIYLGRLNIKSKEYVIAISNLRKGLDISKSINSRSSIQESYEGLSDAYESIGKKDSALVLYKLAVQYKDSILNEANVRDLNLKQVLYETGKKDKEIELLKYKQQIKDKKQKLITGILLVGCAILFVIVIMIYITYRLKKSAHKSLLTYNRDIKDKNKILTQQKEEILSQRDEIENKNILLQQAFETIKIKNNNITDNIRYAVQIQNALLPEKETIKKLLPETFVYYKPKDLVSGDFYWISRHNDITVLVVADCTGHGVTGAFMSILGITALNEVVNENGITDAHLVLNELRKKLIFILQQGDTFNESREGIHMVVCTFNRQFNNMQFAGAINSIYLIRENQIHQYKGDKMPVSISPEMEPYNYVDIPLERDDMVYLFSDGYYGQFGGIDDKKFSVFRFRNLLQKISHLSMEEQYSILERTFLGWKGKAEQVDDILVMGIRF